MMLSVTVAIALTWTAGASRVQAERLGSLTADRDILSWTPAEGEAVSGRYDRARLDAARARDLSAIFSADGLRVADRTIPPDQLVLRVITITRDEVEIAFELYDPTAGAVDLLWSPGRVAKIAAGDVWFGDIFVADAGTTVHGEVIGNVIAIGDVTVGDGAAIRGDVIVLGGVLRQRGDAKIYGTVFAPGGHRRPRLFVPRAGELEEEGHELRPTISYDRVDGFRPGIGGMIQNDNANTRAGLWTAYAFGSETWQFRFDIRQKLMASGMLEASGSLSRITDTDDEETVERAENTAFAALTGSDYRDYFGADGGELALTMRYHELGSFSLKYRNIDYRWLNASRNLWHLFRPNHQFRDNFSTLGPAADPEDALEDNSSSATFTIRIAPVETGQHPIGFNGSLVLAFEVAGGLLGGDYDYDRLTLSGQGGWVSGNRHRIALRAMYGAGRRDLSPNKLFYSGGIGTLRGYPQKIFFGDQSFVGNIEYHFVYWENPLGDAAVIFFVDMGRTTFDNNFWDPDEFFSNVGIGLDFGDMFRINAAKGLDNTDRDIKVSVRMARPW
jgi:hypothetical protein